MKKIRTISLVSLLLCLVMLLVSCGTQPAIRDVVNAKAYTSVSYKSASSFTVAGEISAVNGSIALFVSNHDGIGTYTVTDLAAEDPATSALLTVTENATTEYDVYLSTSAPFFCVIKDDTSETDADEARLYDFTGKELAKTNSTAFPKITIDLIEFGGVVYRADANGKIAKAFDLPTLGSGLPTLTCAVGNKYYMISANSALVYNKKCELISNYKAPAYASDTKIFVLDDGDLLVQYTYQLPDDAEKYSYVNGTSKFDLVTLIVNAGSGSTKRVKCDFLISDLRARSAKTIYGEDSFKVLASAVRNIAQIYEITDGKLITNAGNKKYVSLTNNAKIDKDLLTSFDNQSGAPEPINGKYVLFANIEDKVFLANYSGKVLGEVTDADDFTEDYILNDSKIYNYSLELLYDGDAEGFEAICALDHCVLLRNDKGVIKLLTGTTAKKLSVTELVSETDAAKKMFFDNGDEYFIMAETTAESTRFTFYNDCGEELFTSDSATFRFRDLGKAAILFNTDEASTTIYRLSTKAEKK